MSDGFVGANPHSNGKLLQALCKVRAEMPSTNHRAAAKNEWGENWMLPMFWALSDQACGVWT
jgi:hypothetical protein